MSAAQQRPVVVTVLGVAFAMLGALMLLAALGGLGNYLLIRDTAGEVGEMPLEAGSGDMFSVLFRYFQWLAMGQIAPGALTLVASIRFLQMRAWARPVLEGMVWLGLLWTIGFGVFWIVNWAQTISGTPDPARGRCGMDYAVVALGLTVIAFYSALSGLLIWAFRSKTVRDAMLPTNPPSPEDPNA